jgi:hypothetical protein
MTPIFPVVAAVTVLLNGLPVRSYERPYVARGRVMAPLEPFVTAVAASIAYENGMLIVLRGDLFAQVAMPLPNPTQYAQTFVAIGPVLRTIGVRVSYDNRDARMEIDTPPAPLALPTPFNPAVPLAAPSPVFTPEPVRTPVPKVTGKPMPRRTPLPFPGGSTG